MRPASIVASLAVAFLSAAAARPVVAGEPAHARKAAVAPVPTLTDDALFAKLDAAKKAHRPVILHFWATWCPPCVKELPRFLHAMKGWQGHATVLVVAVLEGGHEALTRKMVGTGPGRFILRAADPDAISKRLDRDWNGSLPATFVLDRKGHVAYEVVGPFDAAKVRKAARIP